MSIAVPTLSSNGWVRAPAEKADFLLSHFYESDKFQTYLYGEGITSIQWIIEQYGHDIIACCSELRRALELYLGRYFDSVTAQVTSNDNITYNPVPHQGSDITLRLVCSVTQDGKEYSFARLIVTSDSKFQRVINLNNEGSA